MNFSVLMACHNRKPLTVRAIDRAQDAADFAGIQISFTVFDDGSTDGTGAALEAMPQSIQILRGDGSAFWAKSMAAAEAVTLRSSETSTDSFLLWLNDDVELDRDALLLLTDAIARNPGAVIVGAMRDPRSGDVTYSGLTRSGRHPLKFSAIIPRDACQSADTFNGNLVVVPHETARQIGGIDGEFSHAFADIDYGLRAARLDIPIILAPGTYGACTRNAIPPRGPARADWATFRGPKGGGNYPSLRRILEKSHKRSWRLVIATTYVLWWARRMQTLGSLR
ncbi:glycosyltransferase family 2 protein [Cryobacterium sp. TMB1-7]|uniref:glycosyltransferase family 2 protein n=1 Tax=Cryobacterium sp. TMB1-7 TaxID=2555866 RepID=UPI00106DB39E|nr:glycosyltransferase [Cryobacterium sp. TMB1-7]TFC61641.1 glycosyltransferase family 2 protein [Cryobacterium sp. TMB1-7]